jgi:biopolymer transport protein ExbD
MRRRISNRSGTEIELFPFLSILSCTIGVLILIIIVITAQTFSSQRQITIIAKNEDGQNKNKQPRYIECRSDGIVVYPSQVFVPLNQVHSSDSALQSVLAEVKANKDEQYLIVAIRPDGIEVFEQVRALIESEGIDIGYEPIDEGWKLKIQDNI